MTSSSADKLRVLEQKAREPLVTYGEIHEETADAIYGVIDAIPALAAVLEAAKEMSDWLEIQSSNCYGRDLIPIREFDVALSELDRIL